MIEIRFDSPGSAFPPGSTLAGKFEWTLSKRKRTRFQLTLLWFTEGVGNTDVGIVSQQRIESNATKGENRFQFVLPNQPQSFVGQLIRLKWAVEVRTDRDEVAQAEFLLTPFDRPPTTEGLIPPTNPS